MDVPHDRKKAPIEYSYDDFVTEHHRKHLSISVLLCYASNNSCSILPGFTWPQIAQISDHDI